MKNPAIIVKCEPVPITYWQTRVEAVWNRTGIPTKCPVEQIAREAIHTA